jgi:hypothetical protein
VTLSFPYALAAGAALGCSGAFAVGWRRARDGGLAALPALSAGAAICLAGASRFAAARQDAATGQELAALVLLAGLAAAVLGAAWSGRGAAR